MVSSEERALNKLQRQVAGAMGNTRIAKNNLYRISLDTLKYGKDADLIGTITDKLDKITSDLDSFYRRIQDKKLDLIS